MIIKYCFCVVNKHDSIKVHTILVQEEREGIYNNEHVKFSKF